MCECQLVVMCDIQLNKMRTSQCGAKIKTKTNTNSLTGQVSKDHLNAFETCVISFQSPFHATNQIYDIRFIKLKERDTEKHAFL